LVPLLWRAQARVAKGASPPDGVRVAREDLECLVA
jgi:hypothetical protein